MNREPELQVRLENEGKLEQTLPEDRARLAQLLGRLLAKKWIEIQKAKEGESEHVQEEATEEQSPGPTQG